MIQSLFKNDDEYYEMAAKYNTYNPKKREKSEGEIFVINGIELVSGPPPCYKMGDFFTPKEIKIFNDNIDRLLKEGGISQKPDWMTKDI